MLLFRALVVFATIVMASSSGSEAKYDPTIPVDNPDDPEGTRDIWFHPDLARKQLKIKFYAVPYKYDLALVKHVDYCSMWWRFSNGEKWAVIGNKRLFRIHESARAGPPGPEHVEDWPIMEPDELREHLATNCASYEELSANWQRHLNRIIARAEAGDDSRTSCESVRNCGSHADCERHSDRTGDCSRCSRGYCLWDDNLLVNAVLGGPWGPGPGGSTHHEIKRFFTDGQRNQTNDDVELF